MSDEAVEVLRKQLELQSGDPENRDEMLSAEQHEVMREHAARIYEEFTEAMREKYSSEELEEDDLDAAATKMVLESVLSVGYELGHADGESMAGSRMIDVPDDIVEALVHKALRDIASSPEIGPLLRREER